MAETFQTLLTDLAEDFTPTFPEYAHLWASWRTDPIHLLEPAKLAQEMGRVRQHCLCVLPPHFFDILSKNPVLFEHALEVLPGVDFALLFHCDGITVKTQAAMWHHLQLLLFNVLGSVEDRAQFGDAENMFAEMDETTLFRQLSETMKNMEAYWKEGGREGAPESDPEGGPEGGGEGATSSPPHAPSPDELYGHLRGLFDGKIGSLAKEMAEEIAGDLSGLLGDDFKEVTSTKEVLEKLMKDPKKIAALVGTVRDKLNAKMQNGEISKEEMMKEVQAIFGKMGDMNDPAMKEVLAMFAKMTGGKNMGAMMRHMQGMMGGEGGGDTEDGMPKPQTVYQGQGVRSGTVGISATAKEKMLNRIMRKKAQKAAEALAQQKRQEEARKTYVPLESLLEEETKGGAGVGAGAGAGASSGKIQNNVYVVPGEDKQPVSAAAAANGPKSNKAKSKNKKGGKK